jgi:Kef-type K+ transport system membrane component KefB
MNSYYFILAVSILVILSYFFDILSKKIKVPSVLLLLGTGILLNHFSEIYEFKLPGLQPTVNILGLIGLLLIVLEAALDLKITRQKRPLIIKAFFTALLILLGTSFAIAYLIYGMGLTHDFYTAYINALPLSVVSSAIVIPSVNYLDEEKKEFLIYESTFSDILGIIAFDIVLMMQSGGGNVLIKVSSGLLFTIVVSLIAGYVLIFLFQKINTKIKFFLFLSILSALFILGKIMHLSSLILILIFGLMLENYRIFFKGKFSKIYNEQKITSVKEQFKLITFETAFLIRTFFFVLFGMTINIQGIFYENVFIIGTFILLLTFFVRFINLKVFFQGKSLFPEVFMAPRGLITILLFYKIPEIYKIPYFSKEVISFVILGSALLMMIGLWFGKKKTSKEEFELYENFDHGHHSEENTLWDELYKNHEK